MSERAQTTCNVGASCSAEPRAIVDVERPPEFYTGRKVALLPDSAHAMPAYQEQQRPEEYAGTRHRPSRPRWRAPRRRPPPMIAAPGRRAASLTSGAFSAPMEPKWKLQRLSLRCFLHASRRSLRAKTLDGRHFRSWCPESAATVARIWEQGLAARRNAWIHSG